MNSWRRWVQAPQTLWLRRALFQVHLWLGVSVGLYVLAISLSGSALLLKYQFYTWFEPKTITPLDTPPLEDDALTARMAEVYAGYELGFTMEGNEPEDATYIVLEKDGEYFPHYFNQYTGEDNGSARTWHIVAVEWLADMHDDLFMGRTGRKINGIGGALILLMSITGLFIWWQGRSRWYEGLIINPKSSRSIMWQLHSFAGFWALLLMVAWGVSGFELGFPRETRQLFNLFSGEGAAEGVTESIEGAGGFRRAPNRVLIFFRGIHFARLGSGPWAKWGWILASFLPAIMFISGFIVWWKRVILKRIVLLKENRNLRKSVK